MPRRDGEIPDWHRPVRAEEKPSRRQALGTAIDVCQDEIEQPRALDEPGFNPSPLFRGDEQRHEIKAQRRSIPLGSPYTL